MATSVTVQKALHALERLCGDIPPRSSSSDSPARAKNDSSCDSESATAPAVSSQDRHKMTSRVAGLPSTDYPATSTAKQEFRLILERELRFMPEALAVRDVSELIERLVDALAKHFLLHDGHGCSVISRPNSPWWSRCPEGHFTDEYFWSHQCLAVICPQCEMVYDPKECRLEPRHSSGN